MRTILRPGAGRRDLMTTTGQILMGLAGLSTALTLSGCGGDSGGSASTPSTGTLSVLMTDSPSCGYDHVYVTVDHIEISADGNKWTTIPVSSSVAQPIDLLSLGNGTLLTLGQAPLSAGTYQQVRLVLKANGNSAPYANSLVLTTNPPNTNQIPLKTPSGQQSGYKILGPITVQPGTLADLILDFNACKSVVVAGNSGQYLLKPVVTAIAKVVSGSISGTAMAGSTVYAEQQSANGPVIVVGAVADSSGAFTLSPILQSSSGGDVDVVIVPPPPASGTNGFGVDIVKDVPVTASQTTSLGSITPVATTINLASGQVTVAGAPGAANIVADQTVTAAARTYEITSTSTTTGPFSAPLAAGGPWVGSYSTSLPILFAQDVDPKDAGVYSLTATDAAGTMQTLPANVAIGPVSGVNFTLNP